MKTQIEKAPRQVVLDYVEAFNRGDVDAVCRCFAPDARVWVILGWRRVADLRPVWKDQVERLGMNLQVEELVEEGGTVAVRYTERGASLRPWRGEPATGRGYETTAMEWFKVEDGLIRRRWGARDSASIFHQLGLSG
jgi:steroid delta-isomerase-like uncharacterized protein